MLSHGVRLWLVFEPVDMRLSFDGLAAHVQHRLQRDPYGGECFIFRSKTGSRLKILVWDGVGFWLHYRRLEQGTFIWPRLTGEGVIELTEAQLRVLSDGLDWRRVRYARELHPRVA